MTTCNFKKIYKHLSENSLIQFWHDLIVSHIVPERNVTFGFTGRLHGAVLLNRNRYQLIGHLFLLEENKKIKY